MVDQSPDGGRGRRRGQHRGDLRGGLRGHRHARSPRRRPLREGRGAGRRALQRAPGLARVGRVGPRRPGRGGPRARGGAARARRPLDERGPRRWRSSRAAGCSAPTWRSRCCTARSARTAPCRGCWSCSTCPTWGPAWRRRRWRWTSRSSRTCWPRTACRRWSTRWRATAGRSTWRACSPPLFVKPARLGSSVGISKVWSEAELDARARHAFEHDPIALVERLVDGMEVECSVLGHSDPEASRPGEIVLQRGDGWYDYEAKYESGGMELIVPARAARADARDGAPAGRRGVPDRRAARGWRAWTSSWRATGCS